MSNRQSLKQEFEKAFIEHFGTTPSSEDKLNQRIMRGQYEDWKDGADWAFDYFHKDKPTGGFTPPDNRPNHGIRNGRYA